MVEKVGGHVRGANVSPETQKKSEGVHNHLTIVLVEVILFYKLFMPQLWLCKLVVFDDFVKSKPKRPDCWDCNVISELQSYNF